MLLIQLSKMASNTVGGPGGFGASSSLWLANLSFSTLMLLVGSFDL